MNNSRKYLFVNASIVTSSKVGQGALFTNNGIIEDIWDVDKDIILKQHPDTIVKDMTGKALMAGGIDAHVHFREPGMTQKGDMASESAAALLGGVTSIIDMPNTTPPTTSAETIEEKCKLAKSKCITNWGFHIGATNHNVDEILSLVREGRDSIFAGVKVFMGSSTGNMLVDNGESLEKLFREYKGRIAVHCEDEEIIRSNMEKAIAQFGEKIPIEMHEAIRSRSACIKSTQKALDLAVKYGTKLHITHVTTEEEVDMIREAKKKNPDISAETSANYLFFTNKFYKRLGSLIKCNPSIKTESDRQALICGIKDGTIDSVGSDHAPHLREEKDRPYTKCPSGIPSIQHSLSVLLTIARQEGIPLNRIASAFSEKPGELFSIKGKGKLDVGYDADIIVLDLDRKFKVKAGGQGNSGIGYKCGWSPYQGLELEGFVEEVYLHGNPTVNHGILANIAALPPSTGMKLEFWK